MKYLLLISLLSLIACKGPTLPPANQSANSQNELTEIQKENQNRNVWQEPAKVISMLGDISDKTVADIGAGTGFFTFRLLFKADKVIAVDIDPVMLEIIDNFKVNLDQEIQEKLETRLALPNDSKLLDGEVDVVIIINTFGYIENRVEYLAHIKTKLKENGQVLVVDFKAQPLPFNPLSGERVPMAKMIEDLELAGFSIENTDEESLEYQYIIIAS